jgi:hypothetical protein
MSSEISEAEIRIALEQLCADRIVKELEKHPTDESARTLLGLLQRSNHLFFKYPNAKREKLRDELLLELQLHFEGHFNDEIQQEFKWIVSLLGRVEVGYRNLLAILNKLPARKNATNIQSSAALELAARRFDFIEKRARGAISKTKTLVYSDELTATNDDGSEFHVDAATSGFVENLGATLGMFAHENKWISSDGTITLPAPSKCIHADPGVVTYSNLLSLGERFETKGKRFEEAVMKFFKENDFDPYSIHATRKGETYEIDVIVPWDQYLFVFECKNRGLSNHHPIRSYYFRKERDGFIQQIKRQIKGLLAHPDMSIEAGGVDPGTKTIVPCILYGLPYAEAGPTDGVFIADWSSLSRFFKTRYLRSKRPHELFDRDRLLHRTALYSFWTGDKPTPDDLLRQLSDPIQIKIVRSRMEPIESVFIVDENRFGVTTEHQRGPLELRKLGGLLGFDARAVDREEQRIKKMVASLNKRFKGKRLITQTRAFREKQKRQKP